MRVEFVSFCEKCEGEYLSKKSLPVTVKELECPDCEEKGTLKILEIKQIKGSKLSIEGEYPTSPINFD